MRFGLRAVDRGVDLCRIDLIQLMSRCADNRDDFPLWSEFLRRVTPKIRYFIRGSLRQSMGRLAADSRETASPTTPQEKDLFQNTVLRLVENECAAMKRFSGKTEEELMAYLAVIARSVVRDFLRHELAKKRPTSQSGSRLSVVPPEHIEAAAGGVGLPSTERDILAKELWRLSAESLNSARKPFSARDRLIFQLYFYHDLSASQIACCKGINLSKPGVEKVLARLKSHLRRVGSTVASEGVVR